MIHPDDAAFYHEAIAGVSFAEKLCPPCPGGATRQESVRLGLEFLSSHSAPDLVLIHDAARPFLSGTDIDRLIKALGEAPGALLAVPVVDTLKRSDAAGRASAGPERGGLWRAQTPQAFHFEAILAAHRETVGADFTDDAAVAESAGLAVKIVPGSERNFKVTEAADFKRAEAELAGMLGDIRVGQGYDVHAFGDEAGRKLILGGIAVPHERSLAGHSDADVGLHALTDAILGALGDADIGAHFKPSDPRWKNAASDQFLKDAARRVAERGGMIAHLDLTFICEAPKIGPHREAMREAIAKMVGLPVARVSVKATTTEQLGFTGRGEGIAAQAVATIRLPF